jgi:hypothetical protein
MSATVENLFNLTRLYDLFLIRNSLRESPGLFQGGKLPGVEYHGSVFHCVHMGSTHSIFLACFGFFG